MSPMGAGASLASQPRIAAELTKPVDASDIKPEDAVAEVARLRALLRSAVDNGEFCVRLPFLPSL